MNLSSILKFGTRVLGRGTLYAQKYSPEILTAVGVAGVITSAVLASRATLKLERVLEAGQERVERTKNEIAYYDGEQKDLVKVYARNTFELVKLYGPSVTLGAVSIVAIIGAQGILRKRIVAITAAYKTLESAYTAYRERVAEKYGEEAEHDLYYDIREVVDPETGKITKEKASDNPDLTVVHSRWFDEKNINWSPSHTDNLSFLTFTQNYFNHVLQSRGHVFLNDVYDKLGFERTAAGAILGWVSGIHSEGDDYISFGFNNKGATAINVGKGENRAILLDFNFDGIIWDKLPGV